MHIAQIDVAVRSNQLRRGRVILMPRLTPEGTGTRRSSGFQISILTSLSSQQTSPGSCSMKNCVLLGKPVEEEHAKHLLLPRDEEELKRGCMF